MATSSSASQAVGFDDLTPELWACADDIINALRAKRVTEKSRSIEDDRQDLWTSVFSSKAPSQLWNTSLPLPQHKPERLATNLVSDPAGRFTQDLPPSRCAVRMARKKGKEPVIVGDRREGRPAHLHARLHHVTRDIEWFWTDAHNKGADPKFIDIVNEHESQFFLAQAQVRAIMRHDAVVAQHADSRNREQAVHWMRCRLLRDLGHDTRQRVVDPSPVDFMTLADMQLLQPLAIRSPTTSADVKWLLQIRQDQQSRSIVTPSQGASDSARCLDGDNHVDT